MDLRSFPLGNTLSKCMFTTYSKSAYTSSAMLTMHICICRFILNSFQVFLCISIEVTSGLWFREHPVHQWCRYSLKSTIHDITPYNHQICRRLPLATRYIAASLRLMTEARMERIGFSCVSPKAAMETIVFFST